MAKEVSIIVIGSNVFTLINGEFNTYSRCFVHIATNSKIVGIFKLSANVKTDKPVICFTFPQINSCEFPLPVDLLMHPERYNEWNEHYLTLLLHMFSINILANLAEC